MHISHKKVARLWERVSELTIENRNMVFETSINQSWNLELQIYVQHLNLFVKLILVIVCIANPSHRYHTVPSAHLIFLFSASLSLEMVLMSAHPILFHFIQQLLGFVDLISCFISSDCQGSRSSHRQFSTIFWTFAEAGF